ncbi:hypothetical protein OXYTRIMIC_314 [Oxytricha trifallax]|uniref:Uncharacterized protein n=1 Tax=Oxytricha trifallax TaxID=1172189 RepID=A0A073I046_9SPIT|nr:hypothetical protein OXYTRIMIC_314 [Oxytricha trifallax]
MSLNFTNTTGTGSNIFGQIQINNSTGNSNVHAGGNITYNNDNLNSKAQGAYNQPNWGQFCNSTPNTSRFFMPSQQQQYSTSASKANQSS